MRKRARILIAVGVGLIVLPIATFFAINRGYKADQNVNPNCPQCKEDFATEAKIQEIFNNDAGANLTLANQYSTSNTTEFNRLDPKIAILPESGKATAIELRKKAIEKEQANITKQIADLSIKIDFLNSRKSGFTGRARTYFEYLFQQHEFQMMMQQITQNENQKTKLNTQKADLAREKQVLTSYSELKTLQIFFAGQKALESQPITLIPTTLNNANKIRTASVTPDALTCFDLETRYTKKEKMDLPDTLQLAACRFVAGDTNPISLTIDETSICSTTGPFSGSLSLPQSERKGSVEECNKIVQNYLRSNLNTRLGKALVPISTFFQNEMAKHKMLTFLAAYTLFANIKDKSWADFETDINLPEIARTGSCSFNPFINVIFKGDTANKEVIDIVLNPGVILVASPQFKISLLANLNKGIGIDGKSARIVDINPKGYLLELNYSDTDAKNSALPNMVHAEIGPGKLGIDASWSWTF